MKVSRAITALQVLLKEHGDVDVFYDCAHYGKSTKPDVVVAAWVTCRKCLRMMEERTEPAPPDGGRG